jgi:hypothetical protein
VRQFLIGVVVGALGCTWFGTAVARPAAQGASELPPIFAIGQEVERGTPVAAADKKIVEVRGEWIRFSHPLPMYTAVWVNAKTGIMWYTVSLK